MKSKLLLPYRFKWIGLLLFVLFLLLGLLVMYGDFRLDFLDVDFGRSPGLFTSGNNNLTDELVLTGTIVSLLLIAFAKEKDEDEYLHFVRLESWQWAVLINFVLLILATWLFYDFDFLNVMVYNMLTVLVIFIIRFQFIVYRSKKEEAKTLAL